MRKDKVAGTMDKHIAEIEKENLEMYDRIATNTAILDRLNAVNDDMFVNEPDDEPGE